MIVVVANSLPSAIRGRMKLWFIEPKPNVFVSGINDHIADKVIDYLTSHCPEDSGLIVMKKINKCPGYEIYSIGNNATKFTEISGLQLILKKRNKENDIHIV